LVLWPVSSHLLVSSILVLVSIVLVMIVIWARSLWNTLGG
jgi:hypothetical protein